MPRARIAVVITSLVAALTAVFALLLQGKLYTALVVPLAHDYYVLCFYASRLPQSAVWIAVIGILALAVYAAYRKTRRTVTVIHAQPARTRSQPPTDNPLRLLAVAIHHARRFAVYRHTVAHELAELAARIIAHRDQVPLPEARRRFQSGTWCKDANIRNFIEYDQFTTRAKFDPDFDRKLSAAIDYLEHLEQGE